MICLVRDPARCRLFADAQIGIELNNSNRPEVGRITALLHAIGTSHIKLVPGLLSYTFGICSTVVIGLTFFPNSYLEALVGFQWGACPFPFECSPP